MRLMCCGLLRKSRWSPKWWENVFWQELADECVDTLGVNNFVKITPSHTASEINLFYVEIQGVQISYVFQFHRCVSALSQCHIYAWKKSILFLNIADSLFLRLHFAQNTKSTEYIGGILLRRYWSQEVFFPRDIFPRGIFLDLFFFLS